MKNIGTLLMLLVSIVAVAQSPYKTGMKKALALWETNDDQAAINMFERIASVEKNEWLPPYYAAQILINSSFAIKDKDAHNAVLKKAEQLIEDAKKRGQSGIAEILTLEAQYYTAWVAYDGAKYGMQYAAKITDIYKKAFDIAPQNPRVVLGKAEWKMGLAQYFGKNPRDYCKDIETAIALFETFKAESDIHPTGGLNRAKQVQKQRCR